jgi:uncharacterized protein YkwD
MDPTTTPRPRWPRLTRRLTTTLGAFGVTAALLLGQCQPQCAPPAAPAPSAAQQVIDLANARRSESGLPALAASGVLAGVAQGHSNDQAARNRMGHDGSDGSTAGDRLARAGYPAQAWAENVAAGYPDPAAVMAGWMSSSGHRDNILSGSVTEIGVGLAYAGDGTPYWTMVLARPG